MMLKFWKYLQGEFESAPQWQKTFLIALGLILFAYLTLHPFGAFTNKQVRNLSAKNNALIAELSSAKILMQDEKVIIDHYNSLKADISAELYSRTRLQTIVRSAVQKYAVRVYEQNWAADWTQDYVGLAETEIALNLRVEERNLQPLMAELLAPAYSYAKTFNYKDNILIVNLRYLVPYAYTGKN